MPKMKLRKLILARRKELSESDAELSSRLVQAAFIATKEFRKSKVLGLYAPVHKEVATWTVLEAALSSAKTVIYPAVAGNELEFRRILKPDMLRKGGFGIPEPDTLCDLHDPRDADLIVIPGIAFDQTGKRIGYGKGYYDRALHHLEGQGKLVGFCYDFQMVTAIAGEPHDVMMDMVITDKRVIRPRD
jgi:5-formyltetrahydrofolate cyclo-ligase